MKRLGFAVAAASMLVACGPPDPANSPWIARPTGQRNVTSGMQIETFFPMVDGNVYLYQTTNEVGEQGLLVARVHREDATHGELRFPSNAKRFTYAADGLVLQSRLGNGYVLKTPLEVGGTWRGEHGGTTKVLSITASADVPAGKFEGCVQTLEERLGDAPVRYATTFCPSVGVVILEAATGANLERAELKSYGEAQDLGPEGTTKFQTAPGPGAPPAH